jgi:SWI/SNF-related matrix-associated actin-dependent regulator 1 of chromatin subfamily A
MDLRKAALHPMLFRVQYTDKALSSMAKALAKEPEFQESDPDLINEDMSIMTDAELQVLARRFKVGCIRSKITI